MNLTSKSLTYILVGSVSLILTCMTFFFGVMYYPYYITREENFRKETKVLELCMSGRIQSEYQLNLVTYDGKSSNCSQAYVFTQTPIAFGALSDMWDDSLIRFVIYGGNWQIQVVFALIGLYTAYFVTKTVVTLFISANMLEKLNPGKQVTGLFTSISQPDTQKLIVSKQITSQNNSNLTQFTSASCKFSPDT